MKNRLFFFLTLALGAVLGFLFSPPEAKSQTEIQIEMNQPVIDCDGSITTIEAEVIPPYPDCSIEWEFWQGGAQVPGAWPAIDFIWPQGQYNEKLVAYANHIPWYDPANSLLNSLNLEVVIRDQDGYLTHYGSRSWGSVGPFQPLVDFLYPDPLCEDDPADFYVLPDGLVITEPGVYKSVIPSWNGCDSLVITNIDEISCSRPVAPQWRLATGEEPPGKYIDRNGNYRQNLQPGELYLSFETDYYARE
jgi:hypothetical protein